jgi:hypothetical protein
MQSDLMAKRTAHMSTVNSLLTPQLPAAGQTNVFCVSVI